MTQDEIIRMALDAGLIQDFGESGTFLYNKNKIERFAALVSAHEREACASLRKEIPLVDLVNDEYESGFWDALELYEKAIQARGKK